MSRSKKIFIGILAFLPLILGICLLIFGISVMFRSIETQTIIHQGGNGMITENWRLDGYITLFVTVIVAIILHLGLLIYFIIHAFNNNRVKNEERIIWVLLFIFVSTIAYPIYWGIRIWPEEKTESNFVKM